VPATATTAAVLLALTLAVDAHPPDERANFVLDFTLSSSAAVELRWGESVRSSSTAMRHLAQLPALYGAGAELVVTWAGAERFRGRVPGEDADVVVVPPDPARWIDRAYAQALSPPPRLLIGPRAPSLGELPRGALVPWSPVPADGASLAPIPALRVRSAPLAAVVDARDRAPVELLLAPAGLSWIRDARGVIATVGLGLGSPPALPRPLDAQVEQHAVAGLARVDRAGRLGWVTLEGVRWSPPRTPQGAPPTPGGAARRLAAVVAAAALIGASFCLFLWRLVRHGAG
jgi:hypothetical protein